MPRKTSAKDNLQERLFQELRSFAERSGIEVRCEKLARDLGYKVRSGGCTARQGKEVGDRGQERCRPATGWTCWPTRSGEPVDGKLEIPANLQPFF